MKPPLEVGYEDHGASKADDQRSDKGEAENDDDDALDPFEPFAVDGHDDAIAVGQVDDCRSSTVARTLTGIVEFDRMHSEARPLGLQGAVNTAAVGSEDGVEHAR